MKISKILVHRPNRSFFWDSAMKNGLCIPFISKFIGKVPDKETTTVSVNFSTNNPKKKGFRKISRIENSEVKFDNDEYQVCYGECILLDNAGVNAGDSFWLKVDKI